MAALNMNGAIDLSALAAPAPAPAAGAHTGVVVDVTDQTFQQLVEQSVTVPVVVDLWAEWCQPCKTLSPILEKLAHEYGGRFLLAKVDVEANQQIAQAFQVQSIPAVVGIIGGQPVPLFQGAYPEAQVREIIEQLLQVAAQNGITGTVAVGDDAESEPEPEPVDPAHAAAQDLIEAGDWEGARAAYQAILDKTPLDAEAKAALRFVTLFARLGDADLEGLIAGASDSLESQLAAADAEAALSDFAAAFARLLALVRKGGDDREPARQRLVELFEIAGNENPDVAQARRELASALY
ncbi:putative thioredoxin [Ruaniaceae bacterium KH17]|nr:putative thioredoxin [Ruaniaceae bacterium KH17]